MSFWAEGFGGPGPARMHRAPLALSGSPEEEGSPDCPVAVALHTGWGSPVPGGGWDRIYRSGWLHPSGAASARRGGDTCRYIF
jgi:hypothetical protein